MTLIMSRKSRQRPFLRHVRTMYNARRATPEVVLRTHLLCALLLSTAALIISPPTPSIAQSPATAMGIDVDFYTGPISQDVWLQIKKAGQQFAIVQAWGGRSRNEFAVSQLSGARSAGMKTAAYLLLNYDDKVCRTFARPVRESSGKCAGEPVLQEKRGGRWQVRQALAALG